MGSHCAMGALLLTASAAAGTAAAQQGAIEEIVGLIGRNLSDEEYWVRASGDDLLSFTSTPARPLSWRLEATIQW